MALASPVHVQTAIGRSLTDEEFQRADGLIALASQAVVAYTGRRFEPGDYTIGRKVHCQRVSIPAAEPTVTEVRSVNQRTGAAVVLVEGTDWTTRAAVLYGLRHCYVEVDFTVTDPVPEAITALVAGVVGGLLISPAAGVSSETAGPYQVSFGNNSGRIFFSASDRAVLASYSIPKTAVSLL